VKLRKLGLDDTAVARTLVERFHGASLSRDHFRTLLADPSNLLAVAEVDGHVVGFVWAHRLHRLRLEQRHLFLYEIEVAGEHRRRGVGTALMRLVLEDAASQGSDLFVFTNHSNEAAVAFYRSLGGKVKNGDDLLFLYPAARAT